MSTLREAAEEALRWMEHARLHLTIKERMHPDGLSLYDSAAEALRAALAKPEVEPPRDEWREAVRDEWRPASEPPEDGRRRVIAWRSPPQRQSGTWVEALYDDGAWVTRDGIAHDITHWRDADPPTEAPIAAKCQRIEGSGEICGLTPPCPDCGSSLIDVPEGSL